MNTVAVLVVLAVSQVRKSKDPTPLMGIGNLFYYLIAVLGLAIAVMRDLHMTIVFPTEWLAYWIEPWVESWLKEE